MLEGWHLEKKNGSRVLFFGEEIIVNKNLALRSMQDFKRLKQPSYTFYMAMTTKKSQNFVWRNSLFRPSCFIIHIKLCPFVPDRGQPVGFAVRATCYFLIRNSPPTLTDGVSPQNQISLSQLPFSTPHCEIAAPKIFSQPSSKMKGTAANRPSLKGYNNKISMGGG